MGKKILICLALLIVLGCVKPPTNLKISKVETNKIKINWDKSEYAEKYEIYKRKYGTGEFSKYWETIGNSFEDIGVSEGNEYSYKIKAVGMLWTGKSLETTTVSAITKIQPPKDVTVESLVDADISAVISWDYSSKAQSYKIYRALENPVDYIEIGTTERNSYIDKTISPASIYYYTVKAFNKMAESDYSNKCEYKSELLDPPRATYIIKPNGINLLWEKNKAAESYSIYKDKGDGFKKVKEVTGKTYEDLTLSGGDKVRYLIKSNKGTIESKDGVEINVLIPLKVPQEVVITQGDQNDATITWKNVDGAEYYKIYRSTDNKYYEVAGFAKESKYEDAGLKSDKTYYYKVKACKNDVESEPSQMKQILAK